jgi:hypothetical protein
MLELPLKPLLHIAFVTAWCSFISVIFSCNLLLRLGLSCVGTDTLFDKLWLQRWLVGLGNVCGCEALALLQKSNL